MHRIGSEDTKDCDPVLAKAVHGLTWDEAHEKCRADPLYGLGHMRTFDPVRKPEHAAFLRKLMHGFDAPKYCENPPSKRTGECMHPKSALLLGTFRPDAARRLPGDAAQAQGDAAARRMRAG